MEYAINPRTGKTVKASDPGLLTRFNYRCPVCGAPVKLRKGYRRRPHFAHESGRASPNCELYVPAQYHVKAPRIVTPGDEHHRPLNLYVLVSLDHDNRWRLELGIPEPPVSVNGRLRIPSELYWNGRLHISNIGRGGTRIPVSPQTTAYQIEYEGNSEGDWIQRVTTPVPGLKANGVTIFVYAEAGGRRLYDGSSLFWGESYVFIWHNLYNPFSNLSSDAVRIRYLRSMDEWYAAVVTLPVYHDITLESWIKGLGVYSVAFRPASLVLVEPVPLGRLADESFFIPGGDEVILGIVGSSGAAQWSEVAWRVDDSDEITSLKGNGRIPTLVSIRRPMSQRMEVWIDNDYENAIRLVCTDSIPTLVTWDGIALIFEHSTGKKTRISLYSGALSNLCREVVAGRAKVEDILVPWELTINLRWKYIMREHWDGLRFDLGTSDSTSRRDFVTRLNMVLQSRVKSVEIDAGSFGSSLIGLTFESEPPLISMSQEWRQQVRWILSNSQMQGRKVSYVSSIHSMLAKLDLRRIDPVDRELLRRVATRPIYPVIIEPVLRKLINDLLRCADVSGLVNY